MTPFHSLLRRPDFSTYHRRRGCCTTFRSLFLTSVVTFSSVLGGVIVQGGSGGVIDSDPIVTVPPSPVPTPLPTPFPVSETLVTSLTPTTLGTVPMPTLVPTPIPPEVQTDLAGGYSSDTSSQSQLPAYGIVLLAVLIPLLFVCSSVVFLCWWFRSRKWRPVEGGGDVQGDVYVCSPNAPPALGDDGNSWLERKEHQREGTTVKGPDGEVQVDSDTPPSAPDQAAAERFRTPPSAPGEEEEDQGEGGDSQLPPPVEGESSAHERLYNLNRDVLRQQQSVVHHKERQRSRKSRRNHSSSSRRSPIRDRRSHRTRGDRIHAANVSRHSRRDLDAAHELDGGSTPIPELQPEEHILRDQEFPSSMYRRRHFAVKTKHVSGGQHRRKNRSRGRRSDSAGSDTDTPASAPPDYRTDVELEPPPPEYHTDVERR